jgi:DNA-binding response OmpR family regulator
MRILVVDDEQDICEILQYNLETEGYEVVTANSAEEALGLPLQEFRLILLDVMMGEMSGFQMARRLKDRCTTTRWYRRWAGTASQASVCFATM